MIMTDNKLLLISGQGTYMENKITIPNNIKVIYLSNEYDEIDLLKIQKISDNFIKLDFNKINDFINKYPDFFYVYNSGDIINNNFFNITNGIITKCDDFNNSLYTFRTIQGLYNLSNNNQKIIELYSYPENINYKEKEYIQKNCMKYSIIKKNFTLYDIFNEYKNKKYNIVLVIMASRNNISTKEYVYDKNIDEYF
jgi:hypothetical protein